MFALFHHNSQVSKPHSTRLGALVEAYEAGAALSVGYDMPGDRAGDVLAEGYEIREVPIPPLAVIVNAHIR